MRLQITAPTKEDLFREALGGLMQILYPQKAIPVTLKQPVYVKSADSTALLVDFLNEALQLAQSNKEIYTRVKFLKFSDKEIEAILEGYKVEKFIENIKAVTYHEANVHLNKHGEWETALVLDI
ncbi:MAG: archease [Candidatus Colwellbacteria bacterium]|nr:archease [Candidatus Colwellbacteria bacterium]